MGQTLLLNRGFSAQSPLDDILRDTLAAGCPSAPPPPFAKGDRVLRRKAPHLGAIIVGRCLAHRGSPCPEGRGRMTAPADDVVSIESRRLGRDVTTSRLEDVLKGTAMRDEFACERCGGTGELYFAAHYEQCPDCRGTGEAYPDDPVLVTLSDREIAELEEIEGALIFWKAALKHQKTEANRQRAREFIVELESRAERLIGQSPA
jgi:hypothetical protein